MKLTRVGMKKIIAAALVCSIFYQLLFPVAAFALTGGPSQPETQSFSPVSSSDMVDLFSGDFKYNIPLLDVGGYPINLIYNSNPTMDQEASWVGLGWNLNPGAINRTMRGIPDDFKGDTIKKEYNIKDNQSWGVDIGGQVKLFGLPLGISGGISNNNYKGYGINLGVSVSASAGSTVCVASTSGNNGSQTGTLGIQFSSQDGISLSASAGMEQKDNGTTSGNVSLSYNNRSGLKDLNMAFSKSSPVSLLTKVSSSISFATPTFTPSISMPLHNNSYILNGTIGGEIFGIHPDIKINGFWSKQTLQSKLRQVPAYGYVNSSIGSENAQAMMDFNREKDVPYVKTIPNLPIANFTYDLFMVNGQGISGQFRPYRGDAGILFDSQITSGTESFDAGIELGFGNAFHAAVPINQMDVITTTKGWKTANALDPKLNFRKENLFTGFENCYFKNVGEQSVADMYLLNSIGNEEPIRNELIPLVCTNNYRFDRFSIGSNSYMGSLGFTSDFARVQRAKRTQLFSYLTANEANTFGQQPTIFSFYPDSLPYRPGCNPFRYTFDVDSNSFQPLSRLHGSFSGHHISEVCITNAEGKRYLYGIPAYNHLQRDVTFNCRDLNSEPANGLVQYQPGEDNSIRNSYGIDSYFNAETVPAYPYAYLLTGILSPDYIDRTGNGISYDDAGEAIKLNYSRVSARYKWRVPYEENSATYNGGLKAGNGNAYAATRGDAKGTYSYGEKELWYMHSIESKTLLAMFYVADRLDGAGVLGENGGYNSDPSAKQKLLKEIRLFSKSDVLKHGTQAIPVKTVHFVYDYSLCPNVSNNSGATINNTGQYNYYDDGYINQNKGKLTLKKVYFTYGNNTKGQLNSYKFTYSDSNPVYGLKNFDRWGNYKDNSTTPAFPTNSEFPYTPQDTTFSNPFCRSWNIEKIDLPSGGSILVNLEADDYAYVQDRRAGQMFFIEGFGPDSAIGGVINTDKLYEGSEAYNIAYIKVEDTSGDIKRKYFEGLEKIYYRFSVDLGRTNVFDYSAGYLDIDKSNDWCGVVNSTTIYVKIKKKNGENPISKNSWQFLKNNLPEVAYPGSSDPGNNLGDALIGLIGSIGEITQIITGGDSYAKSKDWAKFFDRTHSWVRLNNPNYKKLGGGSRVKSLVISDNWNNMAPGGVVKTYGQEYLYADTANSKYISSGVAAWEPGVGNDENPFKMPVNYEIKKALVEPDRLYLEEPFGESFFPAPTVGYSKVLVANFNNQNIRRTATGFTVNEFYTAKDFPVITAHTNPETKKLKPPFKLSLLGSTFSLEKWTASQGYMIELNDMHGKEKATTIYNAMGGEISSTRFYYKQEDQNIAGKQRISNKADVMYGNGAIVNATIGEDVDFYMDMREQSTETSGLGLTINGESFFVLVFFLYIPIPIPHITRESKKFRSSVAVKVIHRYGILDRVVATKDGSTIETRNLVRDSETGEVLMTQTQNEFNDSLYNFTYPAHWVYPNMGLGYTNTGLVLRGVQVIDGVITNMSTPFSYLNEGDELIALKNGVPHGGKLEVARFVSNNKLRVMNGTSVAQIPETVDLKVVRSGRRNMPSFPIATLATVHQPPIDSVSYYYPILSVPPSNFITQASATEYHDKWKIDCSKVLVSNCDTTNPEFCLDYMINLMIDYNTTHNENLFNLCFDDSVSVADLYALCNCHCNPDTIHNQNTQEMPFYNPTCPDNLDSMTYHVWQFGNSCKLILSSLSGNPIDIDSLQMIDPIDTSASCAKVYSGVNHTDSVSFCVECIDCSDSCVNISALNTVISPYRLGMFNNWHQKKTWSYFANRTPSPVSTSRIRDEGTFEEFTPFWLHNDSTGRWMKDGISDPNWITTNIVTNINALGAEIENKDALGKYSAALYGFLETLPKTVASNTRYRQIANDNFEDYYFSPSCKLPCYEEHWSFINAIDSPSVYISSEHSHTGNSSLFIGAGQSASVFREILYTPDDTLILEDTTDYKFLLKNGCLGKFSPDSGSYLLSAWVKEDGACGPLGYSQDSIVISYTGSAVVSKFFPSGVVIEGWQRYEGFFEVPGSATGITVTLGTGDYSAWFDDIRIHPYHSNMKSFVNDSRSLRLMSELDANNYATLYEYDDEGKLIRVKKETERGIMTLKESRSIYKKQN